MINQKKKKERKKSSIISQLFLGHGQRNVYIMEWRILIISISVAEWYSNLSPLFISPKKYNLKSFSQMNGFSDWELSEFVPVRKWKRRGT